MDMANRRETMAMETNPLRAVHGLAVSIEHTTTETTLDDEYLDVAPADGTPGVGTINRAFANRATKDSAPPPPYEDIDGAELAPDALPGGESSEGVYLESSSLQKKLYDDGKVPGGGAAAKSPEPTPRSRLSAASQLTGSVVEPAASNRMVPPPRPAKESAPCPPHLKLGLTRKGVIAALERIDFPYKYEFLSESRFNVVSTFKGTYARNETELGWVTDMYGKFDNSSQMDSTSTGYDVIEATKQYLKKNGHQGKSLCEVFQEEGSVEVGAADLFLSHVQAAHVGEMLGTSLWKKGR